MRHVELNAVAVITKNTITDKSPSTNNINLTVVNIDSKN